MAPPGPMRSTRTSSRPPSAMPMIRNWEYSGLALSSATNREAIRFLNTSLGVPVTGSTSSAILARTIPSIAWPCTLTSARAPATAASSCSVSRCARVSSRSSTRGSARCSMLRWMSMLTAAAVSTTRATITSIKRVDSLMAWPFEMAGF